MNTDSEWLAKLHALVDIYAAARVVPLGAVVSADATTAGAWADIVQHVTAHPSSAPKPYRVGGVGEE